jgi:hypothetical protein
MAHNRSVLKERRIYPGVLTCFAVAQALPKGLLGFWSVMG